MSYLLHLCYNFLSFVLKQKKETVNGKKDLVKVEFAKEVASDDLEALQDMIVIATNNANKEVDAAMEAAMGQYGSMFNGLF